MTSGYYRYPTIHQDTVVFACEDDLWSVSAQGGTARRLTSNLGEATYPFLSPDGSQVAFNGREDGAQEVYAMPAQGGPARRLTYMGGGQLQTAGWTESGKILFSSNARQPFGYLQYLYTVDPAGSAPQRIEVGPAASIAYGPGGMCVIGRNTHDPARWKRYRGGTAGQFWIDPDGQENFHPLASPNGNLDNPMVIAGRIYFLSDHEGTGNIYSCLPDASDLRRHSDHTDFYARNASTDGSRIVYHAGGDLYIFDPSTEENHRIQIDFYGPQTQRSRKFADAERFLKEADLHPFGHALAVSVRSLVYTFTNWEGPVFQHGDPSVSARYRLPSWLNDGLRVLTLSDEGGEESFVILTADGSQPPVRLPLLDIGRPDTILVHPQKDQVAFSNHRAELLFLDLETHELKLIDRSPFSPIAGFDWSPDGAWIVYSASISPQRTALKLWKAATGEIFPLTDPVLRDVRPVFEPHGRFIYFLSYRTFDPVEDNMAFDLSFPRGMRPYLISLQKDTPSPFIFWPRFGEPPKPKDKEEEPKPEKEEAAASAEAGTDSTEAQSPLDPQQPAEMPAAERNGEPEEKDKEEDEKPIQIDLEGIQERILPFPVRESRFGRIMGTSESKVFYSAFPSDFNYDDASDHDEPGARGTLVYYDFEDHKEEVFLTWITDFEVGRNGRAILVRSGNHLRVVKTGFKPDSDEAPGRKSGWIDLDRVRAPVVPAAEWRQMFREAWRVQRDQFWTPDMSQVDWIAAYERYLPLVERVSTRSEFSDLVNEMQGELGTSHCYEWGGDYRPRPHYPQGTLAADFNYSPAAGGWEITHIVHGDAWDERATSPLNRPGALVQAGDVLLAINGVRLSEILTPAEALVNLARTEVSLTIVGKGDEVPRSVTVRTLGGESGARYREWVTENRRRVHEATGGKVGYLHIPNTGPSGFAEFHRGFLAEVERPGLIVDVRFNSGGYTSDLLLEKLARRRLGYDLARWKAEPEPYPRESVAGPMVALTNEYAGSDGDIFSHSFKLMGLGPLIGKRTWGGVIGYFHGHDLADNTFTSQPEVSFWFKDVGWSVENYGTDPDIEIEITPQDYARGVDTQLERAIQEALHLLVQNPPALPDLSQRPNKAAPRLPERK